MPLGIIKDDGEGNLMFVEKTLYRLVQQNKQNARVVMPKYAQAIKGFLKEVDRRRFFPTQFFLRRSSGRLLVSGP